MADSHGARVSWFAAIHLYNLKAPEDLDTTDALASIRASIETVSSSDRRHRLILVVTEEPWRAGLDDIARSLGVQRTNLSIALAERLVDVSPRLRPVHVDRALRDALPDGPLVLDHTEGLFEPSLEALPLDALRRLARNRTVVAHWPGRVEDGVAVYTTPGHPEHVRAPLDSVPYVVVSDGPNRKL